AVLASRPRANCHRYSICTNISSADKGIWARARGFGKCLLCTRSRTNKSVSLSWAHAPVPLSSLQTFVRWSRGLLIGRRCVTNLVYALSVGGIFGAGGGLCSAYRPNSPN
ncbi:unnamed protein product, partial [Ixodes pacificus]